MPFFEIRQKKDEVVTDGPSGQQEAVTTPKHLMVRVSPIQVVVSQLMISQAIGDDYLRAVLWPGMSSFIVQFFNEIFVLICLEGLVERCSATSVLDVQIPIRDRSVSAGDLSLAMQHGGYTSRRKHAQTRRMVNV